MKINFAYAQKLLGYNTVIRFPYGKISHLKAYSIKKNNRWAYLYCQSPTGCDSMMIYLHKINDISYKYDSSGKIDYVYIETE